MSISHFDIIIQYGGSLRIREKSYYEGGYTLHRPKYDRDFISKFEFESLYKEAGKENGLDFAEGSRMLGLGPSRDPNEGFFTLETDWDVDQWVGVHEKSGVSAPQFVPRPTPITTRSIALASSGSLTRSKSPQKKKMDF